MLLFRRQRSSESECRRVALTMPDIGLGVVESSPTAFLARSFSLFPSRFDSLGSLIQHEILLVHKMYIKPSIL